MPISENPDSTQHSWAKKKRPGFPERRAGDPIASVAVPEHSLPGPLESSAILPGARMERVIAYIDGFNLYFGLKSKGWRRFYWLDVQRLAGRLLRPHQELAGVKYFTSRVSASPSDPGKDRRQAAYLEALATLPLTTCYFGHYLARTVRCRSCHATWSTHEEKMTDVNIAVEMLTDAYGNRFDVALLISGDSDLSGPIERIRLLYPSKRLVAVFPPNRTSERLRSVATASFSLGRGVISGSILPDPVIKPSGYPITKPTTWS